VVKIEAAAVARKRVIQLDTLRLGDELWGLPTIKALAQKRDVPFAALAHPKSNPNPKKIKRP
jgi:hypothetical protein